MSGADHLGAKIAAGVLTTAIVSSLGGGYASYRMYSEPVREAVTNQRSRAEKVEERLRKVETKQEVFVELRAVSQSTLNEFKANQASIHDLLMSMQRRLDMVDDRTKRIEARQKQH